MASADGELAATSVEDHRRMAGSVRDTPRAQKASDHLPLTTHAELGASLSATCRELIRVNVTGPTAEEAAPTC